MEDGNADESADDDCGSQNGKPSKLGGTDSITFDNLSELEPAPDEGCQEEGDNGGTGKDDIECEDLQGNHTDQEEPFTLCFHE